MTLALFDFLPEALRILRRQTGLSQRAAASRIRQLTTANLTQSMLSQWERGEQRPSLESLECHLDGLSFTLADLQVALNEAASQSDQLEDEDEEADHTLLLAAEARLAQSPQFRLEIMSMLDRQPGNPTTMSPAARIEQFRQVLERRLMRLEARLDILESNRPQRSRRTS